MSRAGLRGTSAEALATLEEQVRGVASGDLAQLSQDLFGVAAVLRSEPGLRRVATDLSTDAEAKAGLARQIFEDRISAAALEVVASAVSQRWNAARDLADTLEHLGVEAVVRSSSDDAGRLSDELFAVRQLVEGHPELRSALSEPARSTEDKARLLRTLLEDHTLPATLRLAEQALVGSHRTVALALEEYQKVAAAVYGERVATVWVARELADSDRERLRDALSAQYGRDIHLDVIVEPDLLGGMRVEIGDDVIDGAVSTRLDDARRRLAS